VAHLHFDVPRGRNHGVNHHRDRVGTNGWDRDVATLSTRDLVNLLLLGLMIVSGLVAIITVPVLLLTLVSIGMGGTPLSMLVVALGSALLLLVSFLGTIATLDPAPEGQE